ncbi:MAG: carboxylesterase/lipase family protein [Clostridia bacterium]|nr:carboxylesterase/lipase family protein [Clostridia bacterium]
MYMKKLTSQVVMTYDDPVAETKYGKVRGLKTEDTYIFRGIQYAKAKRFHMPEEPDPWEGVKNAFAFGNACLELNTPVAHDNDIVQHFYYPQSERCQVLNIWTKHLEKDAKKPVMVWLHGGGWFSGSATELIAYDGENLAQYGDVVVVSLNHRLNVLGYLDLSDYGEKYRYSGNVGLADLVAALKWVKENIENFGGDPGNVTIFGQSGGGGKVAYLLQTPAADGLYHKGIIQSGGYLGHGGAEAHKHNREVSKKCAALTLKRLGIGEDEVSKIETVPWEDLAQATMEAIWLLREEGESVSWEPVYDGDYFMGDPVDMGFRKETIGTPMIIGTCFGEFSGTHDRHFSETPKALWSAEEADAIMRRAFGDKADRVKELFAKAYPDRQIQDVLFLDLDFKNQALGYIKGFAEAGGTIWNYMFNLETPYECGTVAWHNAEECYVFRNAAYLEYEYIPEVSEKLEDEVSGAWLAFARNSDPNCDTIPEWPACTKDSVPCMCFDKVTDLRVDHDKELIAEYPDIEVPEFPLSNKMYAFYGVKPQE